MYLSFIKRVLIICLLTGCQTDQAIKENKENSQIIKQLAFSPDGHSLAYTTRGEPVYNSTRILIGLWDLKTGKLKNAVKAINHQIQTLFFSPDGKNLALMYEREYSTSPKTNYGFIWHIVRNEWSQKLSYMADYLGPHSIIAVSPDRKLTAQPDLKGRIRVWNNVTKKIIKTYQFEHIETINMLEFRPDSKKLIIVGQYSEPYRYNSNEKNKYQGPTVVISVDLSDNKEHILDTKSSFSAFQKQSHRLITMADKTITIWNSFKQTVIQKIDYIGKISQIQLSPDGRYLAAIIHSDLIILSDDKPITMENRHVLVIWDVNTGLPIHVITDGTQSIISLAISPDNQTLATGDDNSAIRLWNINTGEIINQVTVPDLKE